MSPSRRRDAAALLGSIPWDFDPVRDGSPLATASRYFDRFPWDGPAATGRARATELAETARSLGAPERASR